MTTELVDPVLGPLTLDERTGEYEGSLDSTRGPLEISLHPDGESLDVAIANARRVCKSLSSLLVLVENELVRHFLPLKNGHWLDDDEADVTEVSFRRRAKLESLRVLGGGMVTFFFSDDDMFCGHYLLVTVAADGRILTPELFG